MKTPDLSSFVTRFFRSHLAAERNLSQHTMHAYRDALKLFLRFAADWHKRQADSLAIGDLTAEVVLAFLDSLESDATKHCPNPKRSPGRHPLLLSLCSRLGPLARGALPADFGHFLEESCAADSGISHCRGNGDAARQVDRSTDKGKRDYLLLALLYDTGTRIQEALDMTPADFHLTSPAFVRVLGKGKKERLCPLLPQTARIVSRFLEDSGRHPDDDRPLFQNGAWGKAHSAGCTLLAEAILVPGGQGDAETQSRGISLHTLRHTKAMHLLQSGVPIITIKDVLGHADVRSTEVYVQTDLEAKRKALEQAGTSSKETRRSRKIAPDLLEWLESL